MYSRSTVEVNSNRVTSSLLRKRTRLPTHAHEVPALTFEVTDNFGSNDVLPCGAYGPISLLHLSYPYPNVPLPWLQLMKMGVMADSSKMGMVLELDDKGEIIRSLQDPQGAVYSSVSEVQEENGILFIASPTKTFIGVLRLPPVEQRPTVPSGGKTILW